MYFTVFTISFMYIQCPEPRPRMRLLAGSRLELAANALLWSKKYVYSTFQFCKRWLYSYWHGFNALAVVL